jgi:hypothetical protein
VATIAQYTKIMRDTQADIARKLGVDLSSADQQTRAIALSALAVQAMLIKVLVDKGVVSNAELLAASNAVRSANYMPQPEPAEPVLWDTTPVTGV